MVRKRLGHEPALDGLRGFAVLAVMLAHLELTHLGSGGMVGVDVFFVLSGFLITALLLQEQQRTGRVSFRAFYLRRAARLLPALGVLLIGACVVSAAGVYSHDTLHAIPAVLVYAGNWWIVSGHSAAALGHTWSLAVEEQFYFVWPCVVGIALHRGRLQIAALFAGGGIAIALLERFVACRHGQVCVIRVYHSTDMRMDQLLIGSLLGISFNRGLLDRIARATAFLAPSALLALLAIVVSPTRWDAHWYDTWGMTVTASLAATVVAAVVTSPSNRLARCLSWRPLALVGMISYGLYLWDGLLILPFRGLDLPIPVRSVLLVISAVAMAIASWRWIEQPILQRRRTATALRAAAAPHAQRQDDLATL